MVSIVKEEYYRLKRNHMFWEVRGEDLALRAEVSGLPVSLAPQVPPSS